MEPAGAEDAVEEVGDRGVEDLAEELLFEQPDQGFGAEYPHQFRPPRRAPRAESASPKAGAPRAGRHAAPSAGEGVRFGPSRSWSARRPRAATLRGEAGGERFAAGRVGCAAQGDKPGVVVAGFFLQPLLDFGVAAEKQDRQASRGQARMRCQFFDQRRGLRTTASVSVS